MVFSVFQYVETDRSPQQFVTAVQTHIRRATLILG